MSAPTPEELILALQPLVDPFLVDTCNLITNPLVTEGDGQTIGSTTVASNIPCMVEQLGGAGVQFLVGGVVYTASHRIYMKSSATTQAITPRYKIRVNANGLKPAMIFEQVVRHLNSFDPLVTISVNLVIQGSKQPGFV